MTVTRAAPTTANALVKRRARGHGDPRTDPSGAKPRSLQGGGVARAWKALRIKTAAPRCQNRVAAMEGAAGPA